MPYQPEYEYSNHYEILSNTGTAQLGPRSHQTLSNQTINSFLGTAKFASIPVKNDIYATVRNNSNPICTTNSFSIPSIVSSTNNQQITQDLFQLQAATNLNSSLNINTTQPAAGSEYLSDIEQIILRSAEPIQIDESEEISVNGQRGIWANKSEVINWRGIVPITEYQINQDSNPEIITKRSGQQLEYVQELAIRHLRPPTPPAPGEIIINQMPNILTPPAPPLIIRQQPARPATPEPLVIREAPPAPPPQVGRKIITISGKRIPPPPRKVVIERLAQLPPKPQSVLIERWLPYAEVKRRVIFNRSNQPDPVVVKPRNVIVQWEPSQVNIRKEYKYLGVIRANPVEYVQRYGSTLRRSNELPQFVTDIPTPDGLVLAANHRYNYLHELYGDVNALNYIDLDREGLGEYKSYLQRFSHSFNDNYAANLTTNTYDLNVPPYVHSASSNSTNSSRYGISDLIEQLFRSVDKDQNGRISVSEAEKIFFRINNRLGISCDEDYVKLFFSSLSTKNYGILDFEEFKKAFSSLIA